MTISTVLVPLNGGNGDVAALRTGLALAAPFGAHVRALRSAQGELRANEAVAAARAGAAIADKAERTGRLTLGVRAAAGRLADAMETETRFADVVVFAPPGDDEMREVFLRALMHGDRPVLLAPDGAAVRPSGRIAIGWDGELAAARALIAALPLLTRAAAVELLQAGAPDGAKIGAGAAIAYLGLHGVSARAHALDAPAARALAAAVKTLDIDLLVMGAYGHSRIVETLLGGVTASMVSHAAVPVLMLH